MNAAPELFAAKQLHLLEPLGNTLKDVSETMRINVAQVYGILWAFGLSDEKFDEEVGECLNSLTQKTLEHKHGWLLVVGHTFNRKIAMLKQENKTKDFAAWPQFVNAVKIICKLSQRHFRMMHKNICNFVFIQQNASVNPNGCWCQQQ